MKAKALVFFLLALSSISFAQKYYLNLTGVNDSLSTHLYYTLYYEYGWHHYTYNIYHYDEQTGKENLIKTNHSYFSGGNTSYDSLTSDFEFVNDRRNEYYIASYFRNSYNNGLLRKAFLQKNENLFFTITPLPTIFWDPSSKKENIINVEVSNKTPGLLYLSSANFFLTSDQSPDTGKKYLIKSSDGGATLKFIQSDFLLTSLNKYNDSILLCIKNNMLILKTCDTINSYIIADSVFTWTNYLNKFYYSSDKKHIYSTAKKDSVNYLVMSADNGYSWKGIASGVSDMITLDNSKPGDVYYAAGKSIYYSSNFGQSFGIFKTMSENLVGIFKKSNSDIMYALTASGLYKLTKDGANRISSIIDATSVKDDDDGLSTPYSFALGQNYPNPFNPSTEIKYSIAKSSMISLKIYNVLGMEVAILVNEVKNPGNYSVSFNGKNLSSGVYFYRLISDKNEIVKKMCLIK